jgi:ribosomal protein S12 methylthiotransferase
VPPQGIRLKLTPALRVPEDLRRLQPPLQFCIIPSMRGDLASRPIGEVLREAEKLVKAGVKELLVISQDTSAYGVDLKYAPDLARPAGEDAHARSRHARSASWACGCACTTSIRTRTSTT